MKRVLRWLHFGTTRLTTLLFAFAMSATTGVLASALWTGLGTQPATWLLLVAALAWIAFRLSLFLFEFTTAPNPT